MSFIVGLIAMPFKLLFIAIIGYYSIVNCMLAYLFGSIPFGLILSKVFLNEDIRKTGSGNIGTTNVLRTGNKKLAALTLLLDGGKGAFSVLIIFYIDHNFFELLPRNEIEVSLAYGLFAVIGHCFPVWLKFKGGKGVATALGVLLAAVPYAGLAAIVTWIITAKVTKISSLSALIAVGVAPIVTFFIYGLAPATICALITLLVWIRHKDNIKRLLKGTEPKIGDKKKEAPSESVSTK